MIFKDYYKILGLDTNKVTLNDIKIAYRDQAKKYHPDVNVGNINAEERFKDINEAYKILSNANDRKKYDRTWNSKIAKKRAKNAQVKTSAKDNVLEMFFGKNPEAEVKEIKKEKAKKVPIQGENIDTEINISILEAFNGKEKKISLKTVNGNMKTFNIKIPEGIRNGERIRLLGQGKPGINGGRNGDLLIKVNIQNDKKYRLVGSDIYSDIFITPWEAVLGTKLECDAINETLSVYVPKESQNGVQIKIPNKGYKKGMGERGDLVLTIKIMIPKNISNEEKELYKKLGEISKFNPRKEYL